MMKQPCRAFASAAIPGQVVGISYGSGRLRTEGASTGTIDLAVRDAASADVNATP